MLKWQVLSVIPKHKAFVKQFVHKLFFLIGFTKLLN